MAWGRPCHSNWSANVALICALGQAQNTLRLGYFWYPGTKYPAARFCRRGRDDHPAVRRPYYAWLRSLLDEATRRWVHSTDGWQLVPARPKRLQRPRAKSLFVYNTLRHSMTYQDPGTSHYEEVYRNRVLGNLKRRAKTFGYDLQELPPEADMAVS